MLVKLIHYFCLIRHLLKMPFLVKDVKINFNIIDYFSTDEIASNSEITQQPRIPPDLSRAHSPQAKDPTGRQITGDRHATQLISPGTSAAGGADRIPSSRAAERLSKKTFGIWRPEIREPCAFRIAAIPNRFDSSASPSAAYHAPGEGQNKTSSRGIAMPATHANGLAPP